MSDDSFPQSDRIPLETAHQFLAAFGITSPTSEYERWVKEDGFDPDDFPSVLGDSPCVFGVDWRAGLDDELPRIATGLAHCDVRLEFELDGANGSGVVVCDGRKAAVKYVPNDGDDFTDVIAAVQSIVPPNLEFRASPHNGDSDCWEFAVLSRDEWTELEALDRNLVDCLFVPL